MLNILFMEYSMRQIILLENHYQNKLYKILIQNAKF